MKIFVSEPDIREKEQKYAMDAISKGEISGAFGEYIPKFESSFAKYCDTKFGVSVNSGTTALHLAIKVLSLGKGDEVLCSTFTNMASFFSILYEGATPIPIDIEEDTLNIDPALIESKITDRTKAIMVVHIYGHPVDMDPILEIAKKYNLYIIEDCSKNIG